jgi:hypothetical protein
MDSSADKEGLQSAARKEESSRHGVDPAPEAGPVPGAFGREEIDEDDLDLDDDGDMLAEDTLELEGDAGDDEPGEQP